MHDLVAFAASAARNGLTSVVVNVTEDLYGIQGATGNQLQPQADGVVILASVVSEAIANLLNTRFHFLTDDKWNVLNGFKRDQTGAFPRGVLARPGYKFTKDDLIVVESDNTNNAQLESILLWLSNDGSVIDLDPGKVPPNCRLVEAIGSGTLVADQWTDVPTLAFTNFEHKQDKMYKIHGMSMHGASPHACRLKFKAGSPNIANRPGVMAGDTAAPPLSAMFYGDFGSYQGKNPPGLQVLASAADTAQVVQFLIEEL